MDNIRALVYNTLIKLDERFSLMEDGGDIVVYGSGGLLDSLDLVRLVISLEEVLYKESGKSISLSSNKAMSYKDNPYRSLNSLVEFITQCLQ